jgi:thiamine-phosphate pyrophosphorylase
MTVPRFFLVTPPDLPGDQLVACAKAACAAGDCASIILHGEPKVEDVTALQDLGLAVLLADVEPRVVSRVKADGLHVTGSEFNLLDLRMSLPKETMVGKDCGTSRHAAMEAAEEGADYVGFRQKAQTSGEPLVQWWNDLAEIPAVPLDPATPGDATILARQADFVRPADDMWEGPDVAARVIREWVDTFK